MPLRRAFLAAALIVVTAGAGASSGQAPPPKAQNPCLAAGARLRCPDLQMGTPADMYAQHTPRGRVLLRATNDLKSRGTGPIMFRGRRTGREEMEARQHIYRVNGSRLVVDTGAELYWKFVPGQGHYWKFADAARFELWRLDSTGRRVRLVRTGPKVYYCLRDLFRTNPGKRSPRRRVFPRCSQNPREKRVTLGTSVGWSDVYPSNYHEQWIDVTGLRGCFAYVHRADPKNHIWELKETNNDTQRIVRLPWKGKRTGKCP
jgi:Lysyl oxidase